MGKRGILRVTPRFWEKRGCRGFVRSCFRFFGGRYRTPTAALWANVGSCVLRHGSGESVAVVPRFSGWRAGLANCRRPGLLASRPLAGMALCLLQEICLADDVLVDEQDISAPVPPRTRLLRNTPVLNLRTSDEENAQRKVLKGEISPALLELHDIRHLDLSNNHFSASPVPEFIGSLSKLRYLNLSCSIPLELPRKFRNHSGLEYLNLENSSLFSVGSLEWLSRLSSLRHLDLSYINLTKSSDWFQVVAKLHSLKSLVLRSCALPPVNPSFIWHFNLSTSIETLDLSDNNLPSSSVYPWLFNLSRNILYLNLGSNSLRGSIPEAFQHMVSLKSLDLSDSELEGGIPKLFGKMCSLKKLGLSYNKLSGQFSQVIQNLSCGCVENSLEGLYLQYNDFTGPVPLLRGFSSLKALKLPVNRLNGTIDKSLSQLSKLESLVLAWNSFTGVISETFFSNMSNLQMLDLNENSLTLKLSHDWVPPFQLKWLSLAFCKMGPHFPKWLQTQNQLVFLDISNVGISDSIPDWFWDLSSKLSYFNLSNNHIKGKLPELSFRFNGTRIGGNEYESTESTLGLVRCLDLSSNKLDGAIPEEIMDLVGLIALNLSRNNLTGPITPKIGELKSLDFLDLSRNLFSGSIPSSLSQLSGLGVLDLSYNNLSGKIPLGTQLQSFNASVYAGNLELCGLPLPKKCPNEESTPCPGRNDGANTLEDEDDQFMTLGFYVSLILGFFVGFWGVCGTLMLNRSWRYGFFNFLTGMKDWIYVIAAVNIAKLQRKFRN
ncbi:hypothetical protein CICLE_v10004374mg [Citrus x clementina]|uniref:Leucine-rich repeat-containing N-terminal plant-type domain-containing protein n=1 Tax=Citrus clementina TaxID=85681 RepID=V4SBP6_CITCL|nr:hypothetical protein CICLE_v10004374mg [Citrus x clementina]